MSGIIGGIKGSMKKKFTPVTSIGADPYWSNVSLLLTGDDFQDKSSSTKTISVVGNAAVSTSNFKTGSGSYTFDGSGDYLTTQHASAFTFGINEDFTIEFWFYSNAAQGSNGCVTFNGTYRWAFFWQSTGKVGIFNGNQSTWIVSPVLSTGRWYHYAAVKSGNVFTLYVDGVSQASGTVTTACDANACAIGGTLNSGTSVASYGADFNGCIDGVRITKGVARYAANFTPPTSLPTGSGSTFTASYVDDVFNTYLFTGNGSTNSVNTGLDLAGQGGMVWSATRTGSTDSNGPEIFDTLRGGANRLLTSKNQASYTCTDPISFRSSGIDMTTTANTFINYSGLSKVLWSFRRAAKFFDVVTYTGDGQVMRQVTHSLNCQPGMILIKRVDSVANWSVWHYGNTDDISGFSLNSTNGAFYTAAGARSFITSSYFSPAFITDISGNGVANDNGASYVAYIFAHDTLSTSMIRCGTYTGTGTNTPPQINLGWEPQWLMVKNINASSNWEVFDSNRGLAVSGNNPVLTPNTVNAEYTNEPRMHINATGFYPDNSASAYENTNGNIYIYVAIRRSNKVPASGAQIFFPYQRTTPTSYSTGFTPDLVISKQTNNMSSGFIDPVWQDRLRGYPDNSGTAPTTNSTYLSSASTGVESTGFAAGGYNTIGVYQNNINQTIYYTTGSEKWVDLAFRRAPGFFDIVCYKGVGARTSIKHNLTVSPELILIKCRNEATNWIVWDKSQAAGQYCHLNVSQQYYSFLEYFYQVPDATNFYMGFDPTYQAVNNKSINNYVAYLFATLAGVSKVGSYTGNGSSLTVGCGFSSGARFILIKRTDAAGDWYMWDSARGIVAANDPHISLNTTSAEVTVDDSVDPDLSGFIVNQNTTTNINVTNATYLYLAIA